MAMPPPKSPSTSRFLNFEKDKRPGSPGQLSPSLKHPTVVLGVCAMDVKARSKAMREILTRLVEIEKGGVEVKIFGDVVILEEGVFSCCLKKRHC
jgi:inositol hexakisphosphate/diphosphoinositol-pentakisphosphate kinase